ncbi:MAG TPA: hypothetical protein VF487_08210 [Chitinophagaceae bacterium]
MPDTESLWCPSHRCKPGSQLLGIRQDDGVVAILPTPLPIDDEFIKMVKDDPMAPEQRFRFTNKCIESGCNQWTGKSCGVVERIVQHLKDLPVISELPACGIRHKCRWYHQRKADACKACPFIITEITEEQILELQEQEIRIDA